MSLNEFVKRALGEKGSKAVGAVRQSARRARIAAREPLSESRFTEILVDDLGLRNGDTVFVHSSIDQLHLGFPFYRALPLMQQVIGTAGTLLFPTYPRLPSYEFLRRGQVFDIKKSPSYTGILSEVARRQTNAVRSLHPTKSVCAIGPRARELTSNHHQSPFPYDVCSPYHKIIEAGGKIVGIGVSTANMSFVHCVDDALRDNFPVQPYHSELFAASCINELGEATIVETYAHDLSKMNHNIPRFMRTHIPAEGCSDLVIGGLKFFRADAQKLFAAMSELAVAGKTIYPRSAYSKR
jgi:aminoglycoside 3-N-acetyltransferase